MANQKITDLTELAAAADEDVVAIVDDPTGTPTTKKIQVKNLRGSVSITTNETPTGTVDGSNTTFTTSQGYVGGSTQVYRDGQLMKPGGDDYTETTPSSGTIDFTTAPASGSVILVTYQVANTATGNADTVDNYHANATPTANNIPVLDANGEIPVAAYGDGDITQAKLDSGAIGKTTSKCRVYRGTTQSIPDGTSTLVEWDTIDYDPSGSFDNATDYDFTVPEAGFYLIDAILNLQPQTDGTTVFCQINVNGSGVARQVLHATQDTSDISPHAFTLRELAVGDKITVRAYQDSGSSRDLSSSTDWQVQMSIHLLST